MTRPTVHGPGTRSEAERVAATLGRGLESGAQAIASSGGAGAEIGRIRLRLPAGASEAEIARAFAEALAERGRR
ncbi:MAG TPA: hypothetical protein VN231_14405 [Allosphingosinicella sp.]|nr:hypothetical protein [Allosphingosinicella sp.]